MAEIRFNKCGNAFLSKINFHGREVPLRCKFTESQMPYADSLIKGLTRRWERMPVQRRQLKKFRISADDVKAINIDASYPAEFESFNNGLLNYSFEKAKIVRGDLIGLGLSGGGAKAIAELGVVSVLCSALNIKPDVISGTSGGSIIAAILAFNPDPEKVIK